MEPNYLINGEYLGRLFAGKAHSTSITCPKLESWSKADLVNHQLTALINVQLIHPDKRRLKAVGFKLTSAQ